MLKMDNVLEQAPSAFNQIDLPGYFSKLGVDTHVIVPAAFPESQFPTTFQKFSIGHDLVVVPPKRRYVVYDTPAGEMKHFLHRRFPGCEVQDLLADVVVERACKLNGNDRYLEVQGGRPVVILFTPRSGGTIMARLLNACGVLPRPVIFHEALSLCLASGIPFDRLMQSVVRARDHRVADVSLLINTQFLGNGDGFDASVGLANWVVDNDALVISVRRARYEQAASLDAALSTDVWEHWGDMPLVSRAFDLNLGESLAQIDKEMLRFEHLENLLPAENLMKVNYGALLNSPDRVVTNIADRARQSVSVGIETAKHHIPTRLRTGRQIGGHLAESPVISQLENN